MDVIQHQCIFVQLLQGSCRMLCLAYKVDMNPVARVHAIVLIKPAELNIKTLS